MSWTEIYGIHTEDMQIDEHTALKMISRKKSTTKTKLNTTPFIITIFKA